MKIVQVAQGSPEWHQHRKLHRNASETPAVLGVSPWTTPYQIWLMKTGRRELEVTRPMLNGTELEPRAREAYEQLTGLVMEPLVVADGEYSASLDGLTLDQQVLLEIKCPYKGQTSGLWQAVEAGEVPEHYHWQLQHQLMVAQAKVAHLYVFDGREGLLLEVKPAPKDWPRIHEGWDDFMRFVRHDTPPPLTQQDTVEREDQAWREAAARFVAAKERADEAGSDLERARTALVL